MRRIAVMIGFSRKNMSHALIFVYLLRPALTLFSSIACQSLIPLVQNLSGISEVVGEHLRCEGFQEFLDARSARFDDSFGGLVEQVLSLAKTFSIALRFRLKVPRETGG
jgi:hypothetical protein